MGRIHKPDLLRWTLNFKEFPKNETWYIMLILGLWSGAGLRFRWHYCGWWLADKVRVLLKKCHGALVHV